MTFSHQQQTTGRSCGWPLGGRKKVYKEATVVGRNATCIIDSQRAPWAESESKKKSKYQGTSCNGYFRGSDHNISFGQPRFYAGEWNAQRSAQILECRCPVRNNRGSEAGEEFGVLGLVVAFECEVGSGPDLARCESRAGLQVLPPACCP